MSSLKTRTENREKLLKNQESSYYHFDNAFPLLDLNDNAYAVDSFLSGNEGLNEIRSETKSTKEKRENHNEVQSKMQQWG